MVVEGGCEILTERRHGSYLDRLEAPDYEVDEAWKNAPVPAT